MKINKNIIISIITTTFLISALVYNLLYINNKKNEIIQEIEEESVEEIIQEEEIKKIFVHIDGEITNPGVYELEEGSRVNDLVILAGGLKEKADLTNLNLAYVLSDAIKVTIPKKEVKLKKAPVISNKLDSAQISSVSESNVEIININTATLSELKNLNGIGDATANKIIEYRKNNGSFKSVEELKNVSGIGDAKYKKIVENITI